MSEFMSHSFLVQELENMCDHSVGGGAAVGANSMS